MSLSKDTNVNKRYPELSIKYFVQTCIALLLGCFIFVSGLLATLMILEYHSLSAHVDRVIAVQRRYRSYFPKDLEVDIDGCAETISCEENQKTVDFLVVNRSPNYLKQASLSYFKDKKLDKLATHINDEEWQNYSDFVIENAQRKNAVLKKTRHAKKTKPATRSYGTKNGMFSWPLDQSSFWLSSFFGPRQVNGKWRMHTGVDMAALRGTPVHAAADGVVSQARYVSGYGNTVVITHNDRYKTRYAHLDTIRVKKGARIKKGAKLGTVGDTGFTIKSGKDASHLHFEVYERGKQVNPLNFLSRT